MVLVHAQVHSIHLIFVMCAISCIRKNENTQRNRNETRTIARRQTDWTLHCERIEWCVRTSDVKQCDKINERINRENQHWNKNWNCIPLIPVVVEILSRNVHCILLKSLKTCTTKRKTGHQLLLLLRVLCMYRIANKLIGSFYSWICAKFNGRNVFMLTHCQYIDDVYRFMRNQCMLYRLWSTHIQNNYIYRWRQRQRQRRLEMDTPFIRWRRRRCHGEEEEGVAQ